MQDPKQEETTLHLQLEEGSLPPNDPGKDGRSSPHPATAQPMKSHYTPPSQFPMDSVLVNSPSKLPPFP